MKIGYDISQKRNFQLGPRHLLPETSRQFWHQSPGAIPIAGNNSSLPEIVGECGLLVTAEDAGDIFRAMAMLIDQKAEDRETLRQRCLERSGKFDWLVSAKKVLEIYCDMLSQQKIGMA